MRVKDARQTFVGIWIKNVLTNKPLLVYGNGKQIRDFIYIDDAITALLYAALSPSTEGKALNVGGMGKMDLLALAKLIVKLNQSGTYQTVPYPPEEKKIDIGDYYTDDHLFRSLTCWQPMVALEEGLKRTIEFYKSNSEYYF
jgi:UDP-glucose 4-epimerase